MEKLNDVITAIDDFVWGPVMLILLVGTGIFLTIRTRFLTWRNLGYALKSTLSKEARTKSRGEGDGFRWPGSFGLDVDLCCIWSDVEVR